MEPATLTGWSADSPSSMSSLRLKMPRRQSWCCFRLRGMCRLWTWMVCPNICAGACSSQTEQNYIESNKSLFGVAASMQYYHICPSFGFLSAENPNVTHSSKCKSELCKDEFWNIEGCETGRWRPATFLNDSPVSELSQVFASYTHSCTIASIIATI